MYLEKHHQPAKNHERNEKRPRNTTTSRDDEDKTPRLAKFAEGGGVAYVHAQRGKKVKKTESERESSTLLFVED
jgi:hypothetical protein